MKPPFPWFGGKSRVAQVIWERFGDVPNYVEPFAGSLAVLMARPTTPKVETVNDKDAYLANFWRAVKADPEAVAHYADWPVNEVDLAARRDWIFAEERRAVHIDRMWRDPDYYDAKVAGWWVWGVSSTIGNAWKPKSTRLGDAGSGVQRPSTHLGAGSGVQRPSTHLGNAGRGVHLAEYFETIALRLERVRVMCGDWTRVTSPSVTTHNGTTGMLLDPPYDSDCMDVYEGDNAGVSTAVREWAMEHGEDPNMRIALCGYEGEHEMPSSWFVHKWSAAGGYGRHRGAQNRHRERIWFSPHCLSVDLFSTLESES